MADTIPLQRIDAAVSAWPIASCRTFTCGFTHVDARPAAPKCPHAECCKIARGVINGDDAIRHQATCMAPLWLIERIVRDTGVPVSLDAIALLRDWALGRWASHSGPISLAEYVATLAEEYLAVTGRGIEVRAPTDDNDKRELPVRWRWLILELPVDLLVAARCSKCDTPPPCDDVSLAGNLPEQVLTKPISETHLHVDSAFSFSLLWTAIIGHLTGCDSTPGFDFKGTNEDLWHGPFRNQEALGEWLSLAALARLILAKFLATTLVTPTAFEEYCSVPLDEMCRSVEPPSGAESLRADILNSLHCLRDGSPPSSEVKARTAHAYKLLLMPPFGGPPPKSVLELLKRDPLPEEIRADAILPETALLWRGLRYLRSRSGESDEAFAKLFWQYVRLRTLVYRCVVHEPGTAGLKWFFRSYRYAVGLAAPTIKHLCFEAALTEDSRDICLASIEFRQEPPTNSDDVIGNVKELLAQTRRWQESCGNGRRVEVGLVYHLVRRGGVFSAREVVRYGAWRKRAASQVEAIGRALAARPETLAWIRGIDVAGSELSIPNWPLVLLFERARDASRLAGQTNRATDIKFPPLRATCHVGEEYRSMFDGLRRIEELVEFGIVREGDRLGHAVVLGIDGERWMRHHRHWMQPAEERLDDLTWELELISKRQELGCLSCRYKRLEEEAIGLAQRIYGGEYSARDLVNARRHRFQLNERCDTLSLQEYGSPEGELLRKYLKDEDVWRRGSSVVRGAFSDCDIDAIAKIQEWLQQRLSAMKITVEANPSSNVLTNDLADISEHPILRMDVSSSINADDLRVFGTCLAQEYAYVYSALLDSRELNAESVANRLNAFREAGNASRFTISPSQWPPLSERNVARRH